MISTAADPFRPHGWVGDVRGDTTVYRSVQHEPGWWPMVVRSFGQKGSWADRDTGWPAQCSPAPSLEKQRAERYGGPGDVTGEGNGPGGGTVSLRPNFGRVFGGGKRRRFNFGGGGGRRAGHPITPGGPAPGLPGVTGPKGALPVPAPGWPAGMPPPPPRPSWWRGMWAPADRGWQARGGDGGGAWRGGTGPDPWGVEPPIGRWRHWRSLARIVGLVGRSVPQTAFSGPSGSSADATG